jgi:GNAT superfamily N-acetyltransferase
MKRTLVRLDVSHRDAFYRLHSEICDAGWCNCVAWWVPTWEGWGKRSAEENRQLRDRLFDDGVQDGYLLYLDEEVAGWCQVLERDRLEKLVKQFDLQRDPTTWAVTCFLIAPKYRRSGMATYLLGQVIEEARCRGAKRIEAFPKRGGKLDALDLWNGPEGMFRAAGFEIKGGSPTRPVLSLEL